MLYEVHFSYRYMDKPPQEHAATYEAPTALEAMQECAKELQQYYTTANGYSCVEINRCTCTNCEE